MLKNTTEVLLNSAGSFPIFLLAGLTSDRGPLPAGSGELALNNSIWSHSWNMDELILAVIFLGSKCVAYWRLLYLNFFCKVDLCVLLWHSKSSVSLPPLSPDHPGRQRQWPVVGWQPSAWLQSQRSAQLSPYVPSCMEDSSERVGDPMVGDPTMGDERAPSQPLQVLAPCSFPKHLSATRTVITSAHVFLPRKCRLQKVRILKALRP